MKPDNVNTVFLTGSPDTKSSSFLFQCANYFSEEGLKVLYISSTPFNELPPNIHGIPPPTRDTVACIRFLYLPRWQDLLKQLYFMHLYSHIPRIIIVERLNHFCNLTQDKRTSLEKYEQEVHCAKVCAALLDATAVCAKRCKSEAALVVSFEYSRGQENLVSMIMDVFFNSVVWLLDREESSDPEKSDTITAKLLSFPSHGREVKLEFMNIEKDESLILKKLVNLSGMIEESTKTV